ncbi:hypothetical protein TSTA_063990 [Talaromyces stipitatus ATCC 10500]|uniref:Zn(2)-C6 fungal-type domain-containing protein n=1 Tax=Talaromyces stipitatus (strain ATCC 10500 / CBS 375.48 / QM 6759 / NRRL 1006) TaxID=441959 RepID=B8LSS9_TALSN|nr:uncharacterized protein TSTA_063990 [Talaromyces stipitatus ATCC 10500]EED22925.1 hypothetical protein TSTA_063990 [Talaromyces stipitatus ATCC 10500]
MASRGSEKKRPVHRRSTTGCITCRIRRVKCDEAKPACKRCTSTGRRCDGYRQRQQQPAQQPTSYMSIGISIMANDSFITDSGRAACQVRSRMSYHLFVELYTPLLSDYGTAWFWNSLVLQASVCDESIKHLVIAASSLRTSSSPSRLLSSLTAVESRQPETSHDKITNVSFLLHHGRALQLLSCASQPSIIIILVACVLLALCAELQHRSTEAQGHIQAGLRILAAHYPDITSATPLGEIASTFARLCIPKPVMHGFEELRRSIGYR